MFESLGAQLRKPTGFYGTLVSKMMDLRNREYYYKIIPELALSKGDKVFEIGYGPGLGINLIANGPIDCTIYGIDFSSLMFTRATSRNRKFIDAGIVRLKFGDFLKDTPDHEKFDKIFCVNVIYFWPDLKPVFEKIYSMLNDHGTFCIFMNHKRDFEDIKFTKDFCKYSIDEVESALKQTGFSKVEYKQDKGYYIKSIK